MTIGVSPIKNPNGWVPYGATGDADIIIQNSLCAALTAAVMGFTSMSISGAGVGITHDPVRGMMPNGKSYRFETFIGTGGDTGIDNGFQISLEVERDWLCWNSASAGSVGNVAMQTTADEMPLAFTPATSASYAYWLFNRISNGLFGRQFNVSSINLNPYAWKVGTTTTAAGSTESPLIHSIGKPDYVTLNLGYVPGKAAGKVFLAVDGLVLAYVVTNDVTLASLLNRMYVGSGAAAKYMANGYYIRNLQVVKRPPMFATHPGLAKVVIWGDSMAFNQSSIDGVMNDNTPALACRRYLNKRCIYFGDLKTLSYPGSTLGFYTGQLLTTFSMSNYRSQVGEANAMADLAAENPDIVIITAGSNDFNQSTYNTAEMQSTISTMLATILAINPRVRVVFRGIPTGHYGTNLIAYTAAKAAIRTEIDAYYQTLAAANPTRVKFMDAYAELGGESPPDYTYIGQVTGSLANLHLAARGGLIMGEMYARKLLEMIR